MTENPFAAPSYSVKPQSELDWERLLSIAWRQKVMLRAAIAYCCAWGIVFLLEQSQPSLTYYRDQSSIAILDVVTRILSMGFSVIFFANIILTGLLATQVFGPVTGIVCGPIAAFPFVGLLSTFAVSRKATTILRAQDIRVGFLGANLRDVRRRSERARSAESLNSAAD